MDLEFVKMIVQLCLALGFTLGLMFLSFKVMGKKINVINNKFIKVIEIVHITKENSIMIIKIGNKGYVMTSSAGHMEKLSELSEEEMIDIEENKKKASQEITRYYMNLILRSKNSFSKMANNIKLREEKHDKE